MKVQDVLAQLRGVRQSGAGWTARCPTHDDSHNSLSVSESAGGKLLLNCHAHAGCTYHGILAALNGRTSGDVYQPMHKTQHSSHVPKTRTPFVAVAQYDYTDEQGALLYQNVRQEATDLNGEKVKTFLQRQPDGQGGWLWHLNGVRCVPYRLPELLASAASATVFLTEGEQDTDNLIKLGFTASSFKNWQREFSTHLHGRDVGLVRDHDRSGVNQAEEAARLIAPEARRVRVIDCYADEPLPEKHGKDISDFIEAGGTVEELERLVAEAAEWQPSPETGAQPSGEKPTAKQSQASRLVALGYRAKFFHTPEGKAFARVPVNSHIETVSVKSGAFRDWLIREYRRVEGASPYTQALQTALDDLQGTARYDAPRREIHTRIAEYDGAIYVDLCNDAWQAGHVTSEGWSIVEAKDLPVSFRRTRGMLSLPVPETGGRLSDLQRFINVRAEDWALVAAWLVAAFRPNRPFPPLLMNGEQGSAKSTTTHFLRSLIDPNKASLRSAPRNERELMIAATNGWVITLNNLSNIRKWLSDALCRLSTGGGFAVRENYSDDEETIFDAMRPIIINGIEELATESDLLDRGIPVTLPTIPNENRREESELKPEFERARPRLFGACLSAVSTALRNYPEANIDPKLKPRMIDFARFAIAAEPSFDCASAAFLPAYLRNRAAANGLAFESASIAPVILSFVEEVETWRGTAGELLKEVTTHAGDSVSLEDYPKSPRALSGALKRLAPNLRACGVEVIHLPRTKKGSVIVLEKRRNSSSPPTPSSHCHQTPDSQGETGVGTGDDDVGNDARRDLSSPENSSKYGLGDDGVGGDDNLHGFSKGARSVEEPLTEDEVELAARLEFMENVPRKEAERRAREWFAPVPFCSGEGISDERES